MTLSPFTEFGRKVKADKEEAARLEEVNTLIGEFIKAWGPKGDDLKLSAFCAELVTMVHRLYWLSSESQAKVIGELLNQRSKPVTIGFKR